MTGLKNSMSLKKWRVKKLQHQQNVIFSHPSFCVAAMFELTRAGGGNSGTTNGLWASTMHLRNENSNLIAKMVSKKTVTSSKLDVFSPFFLCCRSAGKNASG